MRHAGAEGSRGHTTSKRSKTTSRSSLISIPMRAQERVKKSRWSRSQDSAGAVALALVPREGVVDAGERCRRAALSSAGRHRGTPAPSRHDPVAADPRERLTVVDHLRNETGGGPLRSVHDHVEQLVGQRG